MGTTRREATIEELLSDPMMLLVFDHSRTTADDVRSLMRVARERLTKTRTAETGERPDHS